MRIYISGPITGVKNNNFEAFDAAFKFLSSHGFAPLNPLDLDKIYNEHGDWNACLRRDIKYLMDCEAVFLLPGWEDSKGARLEITIASKLDLPFYRRDGQSLVKEYLAVDTEITPLIPSCYWKNE